MEKGIDGWRKLTTDCEGFVVSPAMVIAVAFAAALLRLPETQLQVEIVCMMGLCATRDKERESEKGEDSYQRMLRIRCTVLIACCHFHGCRICHCLKIICQRGYIVTSRDQKPLNQNCESVVSLCPLYPNNLTLFFPNIFLETSISELTRIPTSGTNRGSVCVHMACA